MLAGSSRSNPAITLSTIAASSTVLVIGPTWSIVQASVVTPRLLTNPYVGFRPTIPLKQEGTRIDPPVSVPMAARHMSDETAAPDPALEPPGCRSRFQGFRVGDLTVTNAFTLFSILPIRSRVDSTRSKGETFFFRISSEASLMVRL